MGIAWFKRSTGGMRSTSFLVRRLTDPLWIISDVMMPVLGGLELYRALRNDADNARIPLMLMSAAEPHRSVEGQANASF